MKPRGVKKVIAVDKNRYSSAVAELPRDIVSWIIAIHKLTPKKYPLLNLEC
jgi:hypothetical protein